MLLQNVMSRRTPIFLGILLVVIYAYYFYSRPVFISTSKLFPRPPLKEGQFDWSSREENYPVTSMKALPTGSAGKIPRIQQKFRKETPKDSATRLECRSAVEKAFNRSWTGYKEHAWLKDELLPVSGGSRNNFGSWAATLVDTLGTLWIMGMKTEFEHAVVALGEIDFTKTEQKEINVFKTATHHLGGLLSAYDLSDGKYPTLLEKALEVGDMLYASFDTPNRLPVVRWDWAKALDGSGQEAAAGALIAELGSLSLEFTRLSQLTGDPKFFDAIQRIYDVFEKSQADTRLPGMWPVVVNTREANFTVDSGFTLGAMSDSMYEYLPKQYLLLGGLSSQTRNMYQSFIKTAKEILFFQPATPTEADILMSGSVRVTSAEKGEYELDPQMQQLSCFLGGMVAIASKIFSTPDDLTTAKKLVDGCIWAHKNFAAGIMPEIFHVSACVEETACVWDTSEWKAGVIDINQGVTNANFKAKVDELKLPRGVTSISDRRYMLRPETIESIFILYRITGNPSLLDSAWDLFHAIEEATKTEYGNAAVDDITSTPPKKADNMESFWTGQTLKYFYLMFSEPDLVSLDNWVFNTAAHPLKRPN
ncbi:glycosyl hydrolase family 47 protein [Tricladium varicosporioides]|nr:glycosyl hydrolase family 47 protein [Hymenoscyphus varicosporioides]